MNEALPALKKKHAQRTANWLADRLRSRSWNGSDLARALSDDRRIVNTSTVSRWLRAIQPPSPTYCDLIADVFGVDVDFVLTLAGHRPDMEGIKEGDPKVRLIQLIKRVELTPERTAQLEAVLRVMLDHDRLSRQERTRQ